MGLEIFERGELPRWAPVRQQLDDVEIGDVRAESVIREGNGPEQIERVIDKDHDIAILVLAASKSADGPGPLVTHFAARANVLPIPLTIVPGRMNDEEIIAIC